MTNGGTYREGYTEGYKAIMGGLVAYLPVRCI